MKQMKRLADMILQSVEQDCCITIWMDVGIRLEISIKQYLFSFGWAIIDSLICLDAME